MEKRNRMMMIREIQTLLPVVKDIMYAINGKVDELLISDLWTVDLQPMMEELRQHEELKYGFMFSYLELGTIEIFKEDIHYVELRNSHSPTRSETKHYKACQRLRLEGYHMTDGPYETIWYYEENNAFDRYLVKSWDEAVRSGQILDQDTEGRPVEPQHRPLSPFPERIELLNDKKFNDMVESYRGSKDSEEEEVNVEDFGRDLIKAAQDGLLDPCIGRDKELQTLEIILSRRKKNNPMLVGKAGVGKSQVVYGLADRISKKEYEGPLKGKTIMEVNVSKLMGGGEIKFLGALADRMNKIIEAVQDSDIILFIDETHTMMGAGNTEGSKNGDIANMLKPYLADGRITMIGATTTNEFVAIIADPAMERRFNKVEVTEITNKETADVLNGVVSLYEAHHKVRFDKRVIEALPYVGKNYFKGRVNPDIAIDLVDSVASYAQIKGKKVVTLKCLKEMMIDLYNKRDIVLDRELPMQGIGFVQNKNR